METHRKKRGISLSHNTNRTNPENVHQPIHPTTTRINYVRYPIINTHLRPMSTPKPKINFNYSANHSAYFNQTTLSSSSFIVQPIPFTKNPEIYKQKTNVLPSEPQIYSVPESTQPQETAIITQKYESFEHCKQLIGKRLFGTISSNNKFKHPGTVRNNSYLKPQVEEFNLYLQTTKQNNAKTYLPPKPAERVLQESLKINITPAQKPQSKVKPFESLKISNNVELKIENKGQQQIAKERRKDSKKLQEMERKLLQIIKICDQNA